MLRVTLTLLWFSSDVRNDLRTLVFLTRHQVFVPLLHVMQSIYVNLLQGKPICGTWWVTVWGHCPLSKRTLLLFVVLILRSIGSLIGFRLLLRCVQNIADSIEIFQCLSLLCMFLAMFRLLLLSFFSLIVWGLGSLSWISGLKLTSRVGRHGHGVGIGWFCWLMDRSRYIWSLLNCLDVVLQVV